MQCKAKGTCEPSASDILLSGSAFIPCSARMYRLQNMQTAPVPMNCTAPGAAHGVGGPCSPQGMHSAPVCSHCALTDRALKTHIPKLFVHLHSAFVLLCRKARGGASEGEARKVIFSPFCSYRSNLLEEKYYPSSQHCSPQAIWEL